IAVKNWFWIAGVVLGVVVLATVLYFGTGAEQQTVQEECAPTPTNALPDNPERYIHVLSPSPVETPTPTPSVPQADTTVKAQFLIGDRNSQDLTYDGILELDFQNRQYTKLSDYQTKAENGGKWDKVYDIPSLCTAIHFRFSGSSLFEQLGAIKEDTVEYYSYFNSIPLKQDDTLVALTVPVTAGETDSLMIYLRNDEALVTQNGDILASFLLRDGTVQIQLAMKGLDTTDYSRTFFVSDDGRTESLYLEETAEQTVCRDRRTHRTEWILTRYHDGEHEYCLEIRDPNSPDGGDDMIVLYRGLSDAMPTEVYGVTNTAISLWDRIEEAEKSAHMPEREWEESIHTSILTSGDYGTLYLDTVYSGYCSEDEKGREIVLGTPIERRFSWENPSLHLDMECVVANPDCVIDYRMVIDDEETPSKYLLRSYNVSDRQVHSRAETTDGELLWVEESRVSDGEPYRITRTYPDYIRVRDYSNGRIYTEEFTDYTGKRITITQYYYDEEARIERATTRDNEDNLMETKDFIYDGAGDHIKTIQNVYDKDGNLTKTVTYDADGNVISSETMLQPGGT
ncbi:MAG: hypothetical protein J5494_04250, partial [Candidatus Methanomethylophilaceae archaeon]|nr:hypothetical protein [Candidatus Methanomethylophilaceae archaeon]